MDDEIMKKEKEDYLIQKKFNKYSFLRRTVQLVLSVSIFAFFVWYSSRSGFSIILPQAQAYFSTFLFCMLTHTLERKYMFLICNAILAFLAKTYSVVLSCSSEADHESEAVEQDQKYWEWEDESELLVEGRENEMIQDEEEDELAAVINEELANNNTEELNRKFEEFIRKMKEEIRIEAHQTHPIAV